MMTTTLVSHRPHPYRCAWLPLLLLAALAAPRAQGAQASGDYISITSVVPTAQESTITANIRDGVLAITPTGRLTADKLCDAQRQWMEKQLGGWSAEQHAELDHVLAKFSHALLGDDADRRLIDH